MIIDFEIFVSQKYVVQTAKSIWMARSEMTGYSFLVMKNSHKLYFEKPTCKLFLVNNTANS